MFEIANINNLFLTESFFLKLVFSYLAGVLTSLTPCVYPLIPITIAIFGANPQRDQKKSFLLGLAFVFGISISYTLLGIISILTESIFGQFLGNIYFSFFIFLLLFLLGLVTLDIIHPKFLYILQNWANKFSGKGYKNSFLMGATSGLIAAPCVGPVLILIIGFATKENNIFLSSSLLFFYSIGVGTLFLLLATFSGLIHKIPKSGNWLNFVKFIIAIAIFYFATRFLPSSINSLFFLNVGLYFKLLIILISFIVAFFAFIKSKKILVLVLSLIVVVCLKIEAPKNIEINDSWLSNYEQALSLAKEDNKIIILDLYADWCQACIEFEEKTFPDPRVQERLNNFIKLRIDFTSPTDISEEISSKYKIVGLPTILFLNKDGSEIREKRIEGFLEARDFLERLP